MTLAQHLQLTDARQIAILTRNRLSWLIAAIEMIVWKLTLLGKQSFDAAIILGITMLPSSTDKNFLPQGHVDFSQGPAAGVLGTCQSGGCVALPRLVRSGLEFSAAPFQLTASPRGSLSNVVAKPLKNLTPGRGQILLRVLAVGVNFRDVLNVLGMYPGDPGEPGGDVAGIVEATGAGKLPFRCAF
jgi:hypothetical protein